MIQYDHFAFSAPPRTASTWFLKAASHCGLGDGFKAKLHEPFPKGYKGYCVTLVRHPVDWLVSYYFALEGGVVGVDCVDIFAPIAKASKDCEQFLRLYLKSIPGYIGFMFSQYAASTIIKVEDLPWAAMEFFQSVGVKPSVANEIKHIDRQNARKIQNYNLSAKLPQKVMDAEREFCRQYEYYSHSSKPIIRYHKIEDCQTNEKHHHNSR